MRYTARKLKPRAAGAFFIALIILFSCSSPGSTISNDEKEAFINAYVELSLVQLKIKNRSGVYESAEKNILAKNNFTREEFASFGEKISANPDLQTEIYQAIKARLEIYQELPIDSLNVLIKNLSTYSKEK